MADAPTPPIPLVRTKLRPFIAAATSAHPGLLLQRGWIECVKTDSENDGNGGKSQHIRRVCGIPSGEFYERAYKRWLAATTDDHRFARVVMKIEGRLLIGLTGGGALETGCAVSQTYGMPYIPGSSIKGVVRAWAEKAMPEWQAQFADLFGKEDRAGLVAFHDAWWVPDSGGVVGHKDKPFVEDIVTPHHTAYYTGKGDATDLDKPVPNALIGVRGSFLFTLEGDSMWLKLACRMLVGALGDWGIGAKTRAGYGYLVPDDDRNKRHERETEEAKRAALPVGDRCKAEAATLTEKQIAEQFGKDLNKTRKRDDFALYVAAVRERHGASIGSWASEDKNSNKHKAFRFFTAP